MNLKKSLRYVLALQLFVLLAPQLGHSQDNFLTAESALMVPGKVGRFDFMEIDTANDRLAVAHSGAGNLVLVDLKTGQLLPPIEVGNVMGVAIDGKLNTYVLGDADEHKIVFVNSKTLTKSGELAVSGPVDAVTVDTKNGVTYAGEDDGSHLWVIDTKSQKLLTTITISGVPEYVAYDSVTNRIYQNIKTKDTVAVINPKTNKVEAEWPTAPVTSPHGLAIDSKTGRMFIAGRNGKIVGLSLKSGKVFAQADIAPGTDQIAFDPVSKIIYCASKGFISSVKETNSGLELVGTTPSPSGAHTLTVDSVRHDVWISYADKDHSYVQKFKTKK